MNGQYFDPPNTGIPWVDTTLLVLVIVCVTLFLLIAFFYKVAWKPLQEMVDSVKRDTKVVREQTENSHSSAPNPNLRDNIDANHSELLETLTLLHENQRSMTKDISGVREEIRADREAMRRVENQLDEHIKKKEGFEARINVIEDELEEHRAITENQAVPVVVKN